MAIYDSQRNRMAIPFASMPSPDNQGLVVHEAVHAVMDMRRIKLNSIESEITAYVAQALFLRRSGLDMGNSTPSPSFSVNPRNYIAWTGIFQVASVMAELIDKGQSTDFAIPALGVSLKLSPTYANQGDPVNDGL